MTSLEQAIKDAVEKGVYGLPRLRAFAAQDPETLALYQWEELYGNVEKKLLDPAFWQALGKARGWGMFGEFDNDYRKIKYEEWLHNWHRLIDHLASGKDVESFFATL